MLLFVSGIGLLLTAIFPLRSDAAGVTYDPGGHAVAGFVFFLSSTVGLIVVSRRVARDPRWRNVATYTLVAGALALAGVVVTRALVIPDDAPLHEWYGLVQRVLILALLFPCRIVLSIRLLQVARALPRPDDRRERGAPGGRGQVYTVRRIELMPSLRASLSEFGWRRRVFALVVLVTLGLFGLVGVVLLRPDVIGGLLGQNMVAHIGRHFRDPHHRVHDLTFGFIIGTAVVGMLAQLRTPSKNVAGQLMALIPWVALGPTFALTNSRFLFVPAPILAALTLLATILHPTGRDLFSSFSVSRANRVMLALVIIAALPLLAFAFSNIGLQRIVTNDHAALGHYGFMAAFSFTVIGVGLLASLRPDGWRLTAWVAGLLATLIGLASMVFPDVDSSLGLVWALAAIAWGVVFVAAAKLTQDARDTRDDTGVGPDRGSTTNTPRWVYVFGIIALVLVLLFVIMHFTGGGLRHMPS